MNAPVAVSEVFEKEFVEGGAVELDEGGFGIGAGVEFFKASVALGDEESGETAG